MVPDHLLTAIEDIYALKELQRPVPCCHDANDAAVIESENALRRWQNIRIIEARIARGSPDLTNPGSVSDEAYQRFLAERAQELLEMPVAPRL